MKKIIMTFVLVSGIFAAANAGIFLNLADDYQMFGKNIMLDSKGGHASVFNGGAGWIFENGISCSFQYDHLDLEDNIVGLQNVRVIAPIPALAVGYKTGFNENKFIWWTTAAFGAAPIRYRLNVTDYKSSALAPSIKTALYFQVKGQFYAGLEVGYRYMKAKFTELSGSELDLGGIFAGITLVHIYE